MDLRITFFMRTPNRLTLGIVILMALVSGARCGDALEPKSGLQAAAGVGVQYYLSLPTSWTTNSTWPILVTFEGAGHNFRGNFDAFTRARGEWPFIIVAPCVSSNGNDPADLNLAPQGLGSIPLRRSTYERQSAVQDETSSSRGERIKCSSH
jgi:hypothetical protein